MLRPALPPEAVSMSVVQVASEGLILVRGPAAAEGHLCGHQKPCGSEWLVLPLTVNDNEATLQ